MKISFLPSICIHRSIILIFIEKKYACRFFPTENILFRDFQFTFLRESSFPQRIPGSVKWFKWSERNIPDIQNFTYTKSPSTLFTAVNQPVCSDGHPPCLIFSTCFEQLSDTCIQAYFNDYLTHLTMKTSHPSSFDSWPMPSLLAYKSLIHWYKLYFKDRLVGLAARRPPRKRKIPGLNPACAGILSGSSHTSDSKKLALQWLPCQVPGIIESVLGLARCQYTVTGWGRKFDQQFLSQCGST